MIKSPAPARARSYQALEVFGAFRATAATAGSASTIAVIANNKGLYAVRQHVVIIGARPAGSSRSNRKKGRDGPRHAHFRLYSSRDARGVFQADARIEPAPFDALETDQEPFDYAQFWQEELECPATLSIYCAKPKPP
jgi:hypothetical protein